VAGRRISGRFPCSKSRGRAQHGQRPSGQSAPRASGNVSSVPGSLPISQLPRVPRPSFAWAGFLMFIPHRLIPHRGPGVAQPFDLAGAINAAGAPSFAHSAKGGNHEPIRHRDFAESAKSCVGSIVLAIAKNARTGTLSIDCANKHPPSKCGPAHLCATTTKAAPLVALSTSGYPKPQSPVHSSQTPLEAL